MQFDLTVMEAAEAGIMDKLQKDIRKIGGPTGERDPMGIGRCIRYLQAIVEVLS